MHIKLALAVLALATLTACSWVKLSPEGEKVRVLSEAEVTDCKRLGKTTANVADRIGGIERKDHIVRENLEMLARNAAGEMGGDTVVPASAIVEGKQTFDVFKCIGAQ